ncbi:MAG: PstS family phosphate ABC transporter substrate-binding protein [Gemmatimonadetes bacterium]|nr:PstS family phosphate ABC transporter substrate-binding protein [Gemmatimonadota bacterium]
MMRRLSGPWRNSHEHGERRSGRARPSPRAVGATTLWAGAVVAAGCWGRDAGRVIIDGSSTVFPVAEAAAEEYQLAHPGVPVTVGVSGTGGGFRRFCAGETDLATASREITEGEKHDCELAGVEWIELSVAWDGLSVVVNPLNDFVSCLTTDELRRVWRPGSAVRLWRDIRPEWPAEEIRLYGPGTDSGTFDYFTETINGESGASRPDFQASEDDNILVQGITGDRYSLGYLGYGYYTENSTRLRLVAVDGGNGCVEPNPETVRGGSYAPLSRPLYIYAKKAALQRPEVARFTDFLLSNGEAILDFTGYEALTTEQYAAERLKVESVLGAVPAPDGLR